MSIIREILLKTDKRTFTILFNAKSFLSQKSTRLSWDGKCFLVTDKKLPFFTYKIRHRHQLEMAYRKGINKRADDLANVYFLRQMEFRDGDSFFDCGANVGDLKIWFNLQNIKVNYIGFEPSPIEFDCLKDNVSPSLVHNVGLWDRENELCFYISSEGADSSIIEPKYYTQKIVIKTKRLEQFVESPIKCLKLEAEGAEPEILKGLGSKLEMVEYVTADLGFERGIACESTFVPVTSFLLARGFEIVDFSKKRTTVLYKNMNF